MLDPFVHKPPPKLLDQKLVFHHQVFLTWFMGTQLLDILSCHASNLIHQPLLLAIIVDDSSVLTYCYHWIIVNADCYYFCVIILLILITNCIFKLFCYPVLLANQQAIMYR